MGEASFSFRKACQGVFALSLYMGFWILIVLTPLGIPVVPLVLAHSSEGVPLSILMIVIGLIVGVISYGILILLALPLRWMARGILRGAKVRVICCAILSGLAGVSCLFMSSGIPAQQAIGVIGTGLVLLALTIGLLATLWPASRAQ